MHAELYNKNTLLLDVEMDEEGLVRKIKSVINRDLLPVIVSYNVTEGELNTWIIKRRIPEKREGLKEARQAFGDFIEYRHMFSLSDQYWFRLSADDSWDKMNFFTNPYSVCIGNLFFEPWEANKDEATELSPDLTTNGVLRKRWIRDENGISYLIKAGSSAYHQEPISEILASMTLAQINILEFVRYELVVEGMKLCSKCRNFVDENHEFIPASHIYNRTKREQTESIYRHLIRMCKKAGIYGATEYIDKMITADRIIGNTDRHLGNFGFLRNVETGRITGFAPLFDSGSAYWNNAAAARKRRNLFPDRDMVAMENVRKETGLEKVLNTDEMYHLIHMYPNITEAKKEEIRQCIHQSQRELKREAQKTAQGIER